MAKFISPSVEIIDPATEEQGVALLRRIEQFSRISHRSEDLMKEDSWLKFIKFVVMDKGDWSVVEHASAAVVFRTNRGITHEWVRHRLFSYTQESTRFVNYEKKMAPSFIYPQVGVECSYCLAGNEVATDYKGGGEYRFYHNVSPRAILLGDIGCESYENRRKCAYDLSWLHGIFYAEKYYIELIQKGWRPQEARSVFPNALSSRIISTTNLRC